MTLESLIRSDMISSKQILLVYTFSNNGVHDQLRNHRCHSELDSGRGLFQGFHLFRQGRLSIFLNLVGATGGSWSSRQDQGCE